MRGKWSVRYSMRPLRIALGQFNPTVGDLEANVDRMLSLVEQATAQHADVIAFPELAITGYPPEDLLFKKQFLEDARKQLRRLVAASDGIVIVAGTPELVDGEPFHRGAAHYPDAIAGKLYNGAAVAYGGELVTIYRKVLLPNYGVFDEERYFHNGNSCPVFTINGVAVGVNICEDIWYPVGPTTLQRNAGAQIIININGSPFHLGKQDFREQMLSERAADHDLYICYTNMVGGQDELVFDGASMVFNNLGELVACGGQFQEELLLTDLEIDKISNTRTCLLYTSPSPRDRG